MAPPSKSNRNIRHLEQSLHAEACAEDPSDNTTLLVYKMSSVLNESELLQKQQGIHRHQTPPRSRNAARCAILRTVKRPTTAKRDVIHKTGST